MQRSKSDAYEKHVIKLFAHASHSPSTQYIFLTISDFYLIVALGTDFFIKIWKIKNELITQVAAVTELAQ